MEDNGIIQIKDIHGLKKKYKIVTCLTVTKTNKDYLIYTKNSDSDTNIVLCVSELIQNDKNIIELVKVKSENLLIEIKNILVDIINKKYNKEKYILKKINTKLEYLFIGNRSLEISNKLYKILKKDYNSNKDVRQTICFDKYQKEYTIEKMEIADTDFINKLIHSDNYINLIKNLER
ncbi:MAG: hypothetical protein IJO32_06160 [Bacilli bacterium]|nr:hypothetical protein [Bacilli bacterium]